MFAFDVLINGERVLTAGTEDWGLIHAEVMADRSRGPNGEDIFELNVSGISDQAAEGMKEHVRWGRRRLTVGDEVTFRLVETSDSDAPIKRYRSNEKIRKIPSLKLRFVR